MYLLISVIKKESTSDSGTGGGSSSGCGASTWYESLPRRLGAPHTALRKTRATSVHSPHGRLPSLPPLAPSSVAASRRAPSPLLSGANSRLSSSRQHATALLMPDTDERAYDSVVAATASAGGQRRAFTGAELGFLAVAAWGLLDAAE